MLSLLISASGLAQSVFKVPRTSCIFAGGQSDSELTLEAGDSELVNAVALVLGYTGLRPNFIVESSNVPDAVAIITDTVRYIVYNKDLMTTINERAGNKWAAVAVLAHEVGHHLLGHTLRPGGSRPKEELEADRYSGFILEKLGIPPQVATAAVDMLTNEIGSPTHPRRSERVKSVTDGWWEAFRLEHHTPDLAARPSSTPSPQTTFVAGSDNDTKFIGRAVLYGSQDAQLITAGSDVIGQNAFGQPVIVAKRLPSTIPGYAWLYSSPQGRFGVDLKGIMWNLEANRSQVGYIAAPK
jgi:Peptidase family M48